MTLIVILLMYGGTTLITSGIEGVSLACTFQWIINGAQDKPNCPNPPTNFTTPGPQFVTPQPPGSVILNGNPFTGL